MTNIRGTATAMIIIVAIGLTVIGIAELNLSAILLRATEGLSPLIPMNAFTARLVSAHKHAGYSLLSLAFIQVILLVVLRRPSTALNHRQSPPNQGVQGTPPGGGAPDGTR